MHLTTILLASSLGASALATPFMDAVLSGRQTNDEEAYLQEVCFPNTTNPVPPCQEIINIQSQCPSGNTTNTLALEAHAECICGGSFFEDWIGCLDCDYVHGARSEQEVNAFNAIITSASNLLCTGTPTAGFAEIFSSLSEGTSSVSGATVMSDQFPSQTAISLYFTPTGSQGAGVITGSATAATAVSTSASVPTSSGESEKTTLTGTGTASSSSAATGSGSGSGSQTTSSSKGGAAPTGVMLGMLGAVAGGVIVAAL